MRKRTTIDWAQGPKALLDDLFRFRASARGRRLKDLALLGLVAEANGLRLDADRSSLLGQIAASPSLAAVTVAERNHEAGEAQKQPALLSASQQKGVLRAVDGFGFGGAFGG